MTPAQEGVLDVATRADPALVKALARAFRYQRLLDEGWYASISEVAAKEQIERGFRGHYYGRRCSRRILSKGYSTAKPLPLLAYGSCWNRYR